LLENFFFNFSIKGDSQKIGNEDRLSIKPTGEIFQLPGRPLKLLPPKTSHQWNIIFFVMESVGSRYIFDKSNHRMPMSFLHSLSKESWYLKRHFTTSNISTKAIFSLLSGLYDFFHQETFGVQSNARVPSLMNFLSKTHDSFLVTPSPINWYFPTAFVKNSGPLEMHHFENLNLKMKEELNSFGRYVGRDEIQTVDFFIKRLKKAREPFLGIYISFVAHLPYFDYGPNYRIMEDDGRAITRYYNNLYLLDNMIKRIYEHLKENGLLERTILVIVGDHGQAFGQHHPDNYMHHKYSYNENLETPAFIYQPILFKPKTFETPTSHIDILPTILDGMRIPYNPLLFDGESLFYHRLSRRYIFFYGYEKTISSLDTQNLIKVQYSLKKRIGWAFDLRSDPEEKIPIDISNFGQQMEALHKFVNHHDLVLVKYNEGLNFMRNKKPTS
jgi:membrane-anchored protein YejM (alkaline phosphatase superfamily)